MTEKSEGTPRNIPKWSLGILNDVETDQVPGTVLLLSEHRNEPLGLAPDTSVRLDSSMPSQPYIPRRPSVSSKKRTRSGSIILEPQPDDSLNDPLNWPAWRRDCALLSLGFYCLLGGGMTPILAAGFDNVASTFDVSYSRVALTTGLYMMGLGVGSVIFSPTAILYGKRPVYLFSAILFIATSIWCAVAPNYAQLVTARVFQGISVSPVECLPSATIAEIFFLHERAFRIGIYTLLLLGGKNLVPLVSAAIIETMSWRWVFWIVTFVTAFCFLTLFFFVPETFWDRTPRPKTRRPSFNKSISNISRKPLNQGHENHPEDIPHAGIEKCTAAELTITPRQHMLHQQNVHAHFKSGSSIAQQGTTPEITSNVPSANSEVAPQQSGTIEEIQTRKPSTDGTIEDHPHSPPIERQPCTDHHSHVTVASGSRRQPKPTGLVLPPPQKFGGFVDGGDSSSEKSPIGQPKVQEQQLRPDVPEQLGEDEVIDSSSRQHDFHKPVTQAIPPQPPQPLAQPYSAPWDGPGDQKPGQLPAIAMPRTTTFAELVARSGTFQHTEPLPELHNLNSPYYLGIEKSDDYLGHHQPTQHLNPEASERNRPETSLHRTASTSTAGNSIQCSSTVKQNNFDQDCDATFPIVRYTSNLRKSPPKSYVQTLKPWNGRLSKSNWFLVALRPFILFAYPAVLWSTLVYSLSVGWLIVLSESISNVYRNRDSYNFSAIQAGLVYISPFIGGILGTVVAGKVSDIIVRLMAKRNGGIYEPEFRLVMGLPIAIFTTIGLMGFGWSAQERVNWIVPTIFFGVISFGCSLGSTTAITFCVDSYRQYAGEALVTLNFSKNIFHGLAFSLFFPNWLESEGPKDTFLVIGGIQIACLLSTIPMYIYGKRLRMWTVRKGFMESF